MLCEPEKQVTQRKRRGTPPNFNQLQSGPFSALSQVGAIKIIQMLG